MDDFTAWLRQRIQARLALAQGTIELGNNAVWIEQSSGVLVTGDGTETDAWDGTWPMGDSTLTRLMEANDPRDTIARCEAELAILDEHVSDEHERWPECIRCAYIHPAKCECGKLDGEHWRAPCPYPCNTVRLLGSAYKHQPGYREEWAPAGGIQPGEIGTAPHG